jgi:hypothetical protein
MRPNYPLEQRISHLILHIWISKFQTYEKLIFNINIVLGFYDRLQIRFMYALFYAIGFNKTTTPTGHTSKNLENTHH